ncbi:MAG: T9SS type A sorting domain-containing protein, partial [Calditrichia bacterium]|nr:T9SS type A sorting domain-containing protein [Calditrichia bacterium]
EDLLSPQTDKRTAYTWRNDNSSFPPGRLDFQIYSNSAINVEKDFVIQTEIMSSSRLAQYGLQQFDTRDASDHFPKVTDYSLDLVTIVSEQDIPSEFQLYQNYPNPFNPKTQIGFYLRQKGNIQMTVFNMLGQEIYSISKNDVNAGYNSITFDGSNFSSGAYFYQLKAADHIQIKQMLLIK